MPNDGVDFITKSEEAGVHATDGMELTRTVKPVICHICGNNHYANRCSDREEIVPENKLDKAEKTSKKGKPPSQGISQRDGRGGLGGQH